MAGVTGMDGKDTASQLPELLSGKRFVRETGLAADIAALVEPVLEHSGFRLVRVSLSGGEQKNVQIMAERPDGTFTIGDCEAISRQISPLLDAHDWIAGSYRLEVSSPGIDRPLVRASDFVTWAGYEAKIETKEPVSGRRRFRGRIGGYDAGAAAAQIMLNPCEENEEEICISLPLDVIASAKLVLNETLIRDALKRAELRRNQQET